MDINKFLNDLEIIINEIEEKNQILEVNASAGLKEMPQLMKRLEELLPAWFCFIEQTEIGEKQMVLDVLQDVVEAISNSDVVLLTSALKYGLQGLMQEYQEIIKEALDEE